MNRHLPKVLAGIALSFAASIPVGAQHLIGIKAGPGWSGITARNFAPGHTGRTGLNAGLTYDYRRSSHFVLGAELMYQQRGYRESIIITDAFGNPDGKEYVIRTDFDYLALPLKAGLEYGKTFYGFGNLALVPSFMLRSVGHLPAILWSGGVMPASSVSATDSWRRFDLGLSAELGCGYRVQDRFQFYGSLAFQHGGFNFVRQNNNGANAWQRALMLSFGVKMALSKAAGASSPDVSQKK